MVKDLASEKDPQIRKVKIKEIHEKYGRAWLGAVAKDTQYKSPGQTGPTTKAFHLVRVR